MCQHPSAGRPPLSQLTKLLMAIRSDCLVVSLISNQGHYTFLYRHTKHTTGGRKEQMNKHGLELAPSARRGEVYVTLLCIQWANASMYTSETPTKATSHADFCWLCPSHSLDCSLKLTDLFCSILLTLFCLLSDLPSFVFPVSWEISYAAPLCGFCAKTEKGILWMALTHPHNECLTLCHS